MPLLPSSLYGDSLMTVSRMLPLERRLKDVEHLQVLKSTVAHHEAGHAIASYIYGCQPTIVYSLIFQVGSRLLRRAEARVRRSTFRSLPADAQIDILLAGCAAEILMSDLCNEDLNNPSVNYVRSRIAVGVGSDIIKAIHIKLGSSSLKTTKDFLKDQRLFSDFFDYRTARAKEVLAPHISKIDVFAKTLLKQGIVYRPSQLIGQLMADAQTGRSE